MEVGATDFYVRAERARGHNGEPWHRGYGFLVGRLVDTETLLRAIQRADALGVTVHDVLIAEGLVRVQDYILAITDAAGLPREADRSVDIDAVAIDVMMWPADEVLRHIAGLRARGAAIHVSASERQDVREDVLVATMRLATAVHGLVRRDRSLSAGEPAWLWQRLAGLATVGVLTGAALVLPEVIAPAVAVAIALPFLCVVAFRLIALVRLLVEPVGSLIGRSRRATVAPPGAPERDLPIYSLLVPLYREGAVVGDLVAALERLDYPAAKLDVLLILEDDDDETRAALARLDLPGFIRCVSVPDALPRTKPKALNYALGLARGAYVAVFDAEDAPDRDQLRRALAAFARGGRDLACVQARLEVHNAHGTWLTRQFAIEYKALFHGLLPALAALRLPLPLSGTSNHFPRAVLDRLGGWDPHNVTEDADLGIRIARLGQRIATLDSSTAEEAPATLAAWIPQRTRWLKGWMQTYLVHMRQPRRLHRELGMRGFWAFQVLMGGMVLSALVHPLFYIALVAQLLASEAVPMPVSGTDHLVGSIMLFNLLAGYGTALALSLFTTARTGATDLIWNIVFVPVYWLLISWCAYRALVQLATSPFFWEKTPHRSRAYWRARGV